MPTSVTLAEKIDLLFKYGESRGLSVSYRAIAQATEENANNIRKIHLGKNANPGLRILTALAEYFGVSLAYFECQSKKECQDYLRQQAQTKLLGEIAMRAEGISEAGLKTIEQMIEYVRDAEGVKSRGKGA
jgi:transcriptional regulator with XRE-family HTH domain